MKNLVVERDSCAVLELLDAADDDVGLVDFCLNTAEQRLYAVTHSDIAVVCASTAEPVKVLWRYPLLPHLASASDGDGGAARCTALAYVMELDALCVATSAGGIVLLHLDEQRVEEVGTIDGGVVCLEWSPDGEVLALISGIGNLLVMNKEWELLAELPLLGQQQQQELEQLPSVAALYANARISWRGDGKFFATVCKQPNVAAAAAGASACQYGIRIWDRNTCELHASGEAAEGLQPLLAWQPNGRHLYAAASRPAESPAGSSSQHSVLLYEGNGLRHGGLDLPSSGSPVAMAWSCDSELLAVVSAPQPCSKLEGGDGSSVVTGWCLQVWHRSNWHWYLKHERTYPALGAASSDSPAGAPRVRWDEQRGGLLHVLTAHGMYEQVGLIWDTCVSVSGTAAVIDGRQLLVTPTQHGLSPPPMCAVRAVLPAAAVAVAVGAVRAVDAAPQGPAGAAPVPAVDGAGPDDPSQHDEVVAVLTSSGQLALLRAVEQDLWQETLQEQQELATARGEPTGVSPANEPALLPSCPSLDVPLAGGRRTRALCWMDGGASLLVLASPYPEPGAEAGQGDVVVEVAVQWSLYDSSGDPRPIPAVQVQEAEPVYAGGRVLRMTTHAGGGAAIQLVDGQVLRYTHGCSGLRTCGARAAFPVPCPRISSAPVEALSQPDAAPLLGLAPQGGLYWGSTLVASEVTSFTLRSDGPGGAALLYTTRKNLLYTVLFCQLPQYRHRELTAVATDPQALRAQQRRVVGEGEVQAAMHAAMRPDAATAAARDITVRAVEQGSGLVSCPAGGVLAVLQMPRGNLEGIYPRTLVLAAVALALVRADYGRAWQLATQQRLDLNIMVDLSWPAFLSHAGDFVRAMRKPTDMTDLLFALKPMNVAAAGGPYANVPAMLAVAGHSRAAGPAPAAAGPRPGPGPNPWGARPAAATAGAGAAGSAAVDGSAGVDTSGSSKVNAVCRAVREAVEALPNHRAYLNVIVSSYVKSDPPQLEEAMRCIRDAKESELAQAPAGVAPAPAPATCAPAATTLPDGPAGTSASPSSVANGSGGAPPAAEGHAPSDTALKHLLLWVDADELYRVALGMYELPLAYMVVVHSQKDPGEYLQELQRFAAIAQPSMQRYAIDLHLRRYASALGHLVAAGTQHFDKVLQLARERGLLRQALQLYDDDPERRPLVLDAYGDSLSAAKKHEDAALAYMAAGQAAKALGAYRAGGKWRMVFAVAGHMEYSEQQVLELAAEVVEELSSSAQLADAAAVLLHYLQDVDSAVKAYAQAKEWREALRVAHQHQRQDLVETVVAPRAAAGAAALLDDARQAVERIAKYQQRLGDVRTKRLAMAAAVAAADEDAEAGGLADDLQSDVVSLVSGLSVYTDATGAPTASSAAPSATPSTVGGRKPMRNDKKSKKGDRIRQGCPQEEASLVQHMYSLGPLPSVLEEAGQLCELLVLLGHMADARTLQQAVAKWQAAFQEACADVSNHPLHIGLARAVAKDTPADTSAIVWKWDILRAL